MKTKLNYKCIYSESYTEAPEDGIDMKLDYIYKLLSKNIIGVLLNISINDDINISYKFRNIEEPIEGVLCDLKCRQYSEDKNDYEFLDIRVDLFRRSPNSNDGDNDTYYFIDSRSRFLNYTIDVLNDREFIIYNMKIEILIIESISCLLEVQDV